MDKKVQILCADLADAKLDSATVVFIYLPIPYLPQLLDSLHARLPSGSRIVAHEQSPLALNGRPPQVSKPLFADRALTVAHLWQVS